MRISMGFTRANGNCEGLIEFFLHAKDKKGHWRRQTFRSTWVVVNTGQTESELRLECVRVLMNKRLPELFRMLERIIETTIGVDDNRMVFKFTNWYIE